MSLYITLFAIVILAGVSVTSIGGVGNVDDQRASSIESVSNIVQELEPEVITPEAEEPAEPTQSISDERQVEIYNENELRIEARRIQTEIYNKKIDMINAMIEERKSDGDGYDDLEMNKLELYYEYRNATI